MRVLQINTTVNAGSTGRHAENVGKVLLRNGHQSVIAFGRGTPVSKSELIRIGNRFDQGIHVLNTRLLDRHGLASRAATRTFLEKLDKNRPELVHLRNIHGYYLDIQSLFAYLAETGIPVIWTFHDCWPFTGHCSHFERVKCQKWMKECHSCPNKHGYPASWGLDRSTPNFRLKKKLFTSLESLRIITPSHWLKKHVTNSFFQDTPVEVIHNGIDLDTFKPLDDDTLADDLNLRGAKVILGVSNVWTRHKGLQDFIALAEMLPEEYRIVLLGFTSHQLKGLPRKITGLERTSSIHELARYYSLADVHANLSYSDNFPTTNLESLACGTPVVTYNTGGSPEALSQETGRVVRQGDIRAAAEAIIETAGAYNQDMKRLCRKRAEELFNKDERFEDYLEVYKSILKT